MTLKKSVLLGLGLLSVVSTCPRLAAAADSGTCEHLCAPLESARFDKQLAALEEFIPENTKSAKEIDAAIEKIESKDARNYLFKVEGLARLYAGIYGKGMKEQRVAVKEAEDLVGWYKDKVDFLAFARQVGAPKGVLTAMEATRQKSHDALAAYMPKFRGMVDELKSEISESDWENQTRDRKHVVQQLIDELKKREPLDYDLHDLANGIHEMRRNLRWILIYMQALDGMFVADRGAGDIHEYSYLETHPIAQSRFSKLDPNARVKNPVHIPFTYFLALSKLVEELGVIKSTGEHVEAITQGYLDSGLAKTKKEAEAKAEKLVAHDPAAVPDITAAAEKVRDELARTKLLKRLRQTLEAAIE